MTVIQLLQKFPDDASAERWFEEQRWPEGRFCPDCGSTNIAEVANRKPMPYRCRDCRSHFSVKKGTVMQSSKLGLQKWAHRPLHDDDGDQGHVEHEDLPGARHPSGDGMVSDAAYS